MSAHIILINKAGLIFLTQRRDVPLWVIPGGHINKGESSKMAVLRELYEETGIKIRDAKLIAKYYDKNGKVKKNLYSGKFLGNISIKESDEVRDAKWFNCRQLPWPITLYERNKINDFLIFNDKIITRLDSINSKLELLNQLKNPLIFFWLLLNLIKNQLTTRTFKF